MKDKIIPADLLELLENGQHQKIISFLSASHSVEVADVISCLPVAEAWNILQLSPPSSAAEIFSHFDLDYQIGMIDALSRRDAAQLISSMPPDDRAARFKRLPEEKIEMVLPALAKAEREDIRCLTSYEASTAGAVMTSDYATLSPTMTVAQAIEHLREVAPDKETIYYAYVVASKRLLIGFVSLKDLIIARRLDRIEDIMHQDVISANVNEDQEEAAGKIQKFDLIALPVINKQGSLIGIITHDDALDIITQEHTEDMEKLMAISGSHESGVYLRTSSWVHFKNRAYWIVGLAALGLVSGIIIHSFESTLTNMIILALYMPMVADTGGNTGSQAATVVVRALALKEISTKDFLKVIFKEFKISLLLALILGVLSWGKVMFLSHNTVIPHGSSLSKIGVAIALALSLQVVTATLIGAILPIGAAKFNLDPAVVASPALTTIVDITGLLIYFMTAKLLLGI